MTISSSISRSFLRAIAVSLICIAVPSTVFAAVKITDVMYDPPGADDGHEWIEIANQGNEPVDLYGYRLYEGGTNHKLTVAVGTSTLAAGAKAIIATDPTQYASDNPSFTGAVFKSSFSLSNTGETIELKDAKLQVVDSYSYAAPPKVAAPKTPAAKAAKKSATPKGASSYTYTDPTLAGSDMAALPTLALPMLPHISSTWLYGSLLAALFLLGLGFVFYAKLFTPRRIVAETSTGSEEFELER